MKRAFVAVLSLIYGTIARLRGPSYLLLLLIAFRLHAQIFMANNGNDSNPGTIGSPVLTLDKARQIANTAGINQTIYARQGIYYNVHAKFQGPQAGTGQDSTGLTISAYPGDTNVWFFGGQPLTGTSGWTQCTGSSNFMWYAALGAFPTLLSFETQVAPWCTNWQVRCLYVDGAMATRAQLPSIASGVSYLYTNTSSAPNLALIGFANNQIPGTLNPANAEVMIDGSWLSSTEHAQSIAFVSSTCNITLSNAFQNSGSGLGFNYIPNIQSARIYNTQEGVTQPGQFFWDETNQVVYYYPIGGKNPNTSFIVVPTVATMFYYYGYSGANQFANANGPPNFTISNLTCLVNTFYPGWEADYGANEDPSSMFSCNVGGSGGNNVTITHCKLGWCAGGGIGGDYAWVTNVNIISNEVGFCGNTGVVMRNGPNIVVSNNYIHDIGSMVFQAPGVRANISSKIVQNNIWNCSEEGFGDYNCSNNYVAMNSFSNLMQKDEDHGAYYQYIGSGGPVTPTGNIIESNIFQAVGVDWNHTITNGVGSADARNFFRPAIYLDEQSSNEVVRYNVTLNCPIPTFQNLAASNAIQTNIFINTNADLVTQYPAMRIYSSSGCSALLFQGNVEQTAGTLDWDNSGNYTGAAPNLAYSTAGSFTVPSFVTQSNPQFSSLYPPLGYSAGSPALSDGLPALLLVQATTMNGVTVPTIPISAASMFTGTVFMNGQIGAQ